jgi:hypothetical protein
MPEFDLISKQEEEGLTSGWLTKFIRFGVIVFILVLILYFALDYGYLRILDKRIADVENNIQALEKEIPAQDREEVSVFYSQLVNLRKLLENHVYSSNIFQRLELITHPQVSFTNFDYDFDENRLKLEGYGVSLPVLAEQLLSFQRTADFRKITISDVRKTSIGRINFSLEVFFNLPLILNKI